MTKVSYLHQRSAFYDTVKMRVDEYYSKNKLSTFGNWKLYFKTLTLIPLAIIIYIAVLRFSLPPFLALTLCSLLGFVMACIGFNVMHDA